MWLCGIKSTLHDLLNVRRHIPKPGMVDPVSGGIVGDGKTSYGISVDIIIELEEDTEAGVCEDDMRRFGENVVVRKTFFCFRESLGCQVLLDREMRELNYLLAFLIDDGNETRTYGQNGFSGVFWTPIFVKYRGRHLVELNCKDLRELFDAKRANRHRETFEQSLCIFSLLFIDVLQRTGICFVQSLW